MTHDYSLARHVNLEAERVRIRRGKDVFGDIGAMSPALGSVWRLTPEHGPERVIWIDEIRAAVRSISFFEIIFAEDPETAWAETRHVMGFGAFGEEFAEHQVRYGGIVSPTRWRTVASVILAFGEHPDWTVGDVELTLPFVRNICCIAERGGRPHGL